MFKILMNANNTGDVDSRTTVRPIKNQMKCNFFKCLNTDALRSKHRSGLYLHKMYLFVP